MQMMPFESPMVTSPGKTVTPAQPAAEDRQPMVEIAGALETPPSYTTLTEPFASRCVMIIAPRKAERLSPFIATTNTSHALTRAIAPPLSLGRSPHAVASIRSLRTGMVSTVKAPLSRR